MTRAGDIICGWHHMNELKFWMEKSFSKKMFSFHQIFKQGQNIKIEIWKCPIKVELVKKSSHRGGTSL